MCARVCVLGHINMKPRFRSVFYQPIKTNNDVEGWHLRFNRQARSAAQLLPPASDAQRGIRNGRRTDATPGGPGDFPLQETSPQVIND